MDQAFFLRAQRLLEQRPSAQLRYADLAAQAVARQEVTPTARAHGRVVAELKTKSSPDTLASLLLGEEGWSGAATGQSCFSRAMAIRRINPR